MALVSSLHAKHSINTPLQSSLKDAWHVWAVVGNAPIVRQTDKPVKHKRALILAENLEKGKLKATRVVVVRA